MNTVKWSGNRGTDIENSYYESRPEEPYPSSEIAITVGLCVGQLSAIAVSQARSLVELIPLAVESVRIAFRTGMTATTIRDELEQQSSPTETWAMTLPSEVGNELLNIIHKETVRCCDFSYHVLANSPRLPWSERGHMLAPHSERP